ncbi:MAG: hypothetical protein H6573_20705 [Lewinellaceae bacterium]|nr:hypothetical protein [Lewinellaceae bacterium]
MDHSYVFKYFGGRLTELKDEFGFKLFDNNPCSIKDKGDLVKFVNRLAEELFEEDNFSFINEDESNTVLKFNYKGQELSFAIDSKFGHIETDFYKTVQFMAFLSDKMIATVNPSGEYIVGDEEDIREAWSRGLPIHIPEINFRHRNISGKYFKKQEVGAKFLVEGTVTLEKYESELIAGLNDFLKERAYNIEYSSKQIKAYFDHKKQICVLINGDYGGGIIVNSDQMIVKNSFENQIFLSRYFKRYPESRILYKEEGSEKAEVVLNFFDFILNFGRDE